MVGRVLLNASHLGCAALTCAQHLPTSRYSIVCALNSRGCKENTYPRPLPLRGPFGLRRLRGRQYTVPHEKDERPRERGRFRFGGTRHPYLCTTAGRATFIENGGLPVSFVGRRDFVGSVLGADLTSRKVFPPLVKSSRNRPLPPIVALTCSITDIFAVSLARWR